MSGMEVDLALNARKFQAGVQDAERGLKELSDEFDDLVQSSEKVERAADAAMDATGDGAKDAERDMQDLARRTEDLADEFRDAARKVDDLGDDADQAADKVRRGFGRAEEGVEEFRDEANSTAREAAASFDGSAESIGDAFQEVAANAFAGFGPVGAVAGIAAAAGIGLAADGFEAVGEANEESQQRVDEWASTFIEAGGRVLDSQTYVAAANAILTDGEQYRTAARNAEIWGVSVETAVAAMTGQHGALEEAQRNVTAAAAAEAAALEGVPYDDVGTNIAAMTSEAMEGQRALNGITGEMDSGAVRAGIMSDYLRNLAQTTDGATSAVDEFGDTVYALPDGTTVYVDAETGRATQNVDDIEARIYGIPDAHASVNLSTSSADAALNRWRNQRRTLTVTANVIVPRGMRLPV